MIQDKISAFPDGNSFVSYHKDGKKLVIGNSEGLVKIFNLEEPDLEPVSIDVLENLTTLASHGDDLLLTNTSGNLELISLNNNESKGSIYRSELPLRDAVFVNEGKRILCGGDDNKLVVIDLQNGNSTNVVSLPDQLVNLSYNFAGENLAVSLANGHLQLYSIVNEVPNLIHTIQNILPQKVHMSLDKIDYIDEHIDELVSTKAQWTSDGRYLLVPGTSTINVYDRSTWSETQKFDLSEKIIDYTLSDSHLCVLHSTKVKVLDYNTKKVLFESSFDLEGNLPLNIAWNQGSIYVGTSGGDAVTLKDVIDITASSAKVTSTDLIGNLFLDEANEDSDEEDDFLGGPEDEIAVANGNGHANGYKLHEEDSMVIDEDDELELPTERKRHKPNGYLAPRSIHNIPRAVTSVSSEYLKPYSPGSTPWSSEHGESSNADRRYLFMNSIGYVWSVKTLGGGESAQQQSITVSFFDRSVHKDYHFIDYFGFDLCSINEQGTLLSTSGYQDRKNGESGKIYYRNHDSEQGSWEKKIPLLKGEFISSISITSSTEISHDSLIIVGTNLGYVRFFNSHGVCINIMKTSPVVTLISSSNSVVFMVNSVSYDVYTYSVLDVNQEYKFIQQNVFLPLKRPENPEVPLIKGTFFNEYNDPCLVGGADDTLIILQSWRESNNSKWIPILNCHAIVTEHGNNSNKKNWKCWPLGLYRDQLSCLILKNSRQYPDFPLPLPIELEIKIPIQVHSKIEKKKTRPEDELLDDEEIESNDTPDVQEDPEELFLRSSTMGKIISDALNDENTEADQDEIMERLTQYSRIFDRSLLKMFGEACKESRLNKALSIAKMIKTDGALAAAAKISERMQFLTLATKISKLREDLIDLSDEE